MVPSPAIVLEHDQYDPLPSVWQGGDAELLEKMLRFYPKSPPDQILDATVNYGRFWKGSTRRVIGLDIDSRYRPTIVGDGMTMPFRDEAFDVVVYDPPHVPNQGKGLHRQIWPSSQIGVGDRLQSLTHIWTIPARSLPSSSSPRYFTVQNHRLRPQPRDHVLESLVSSVQYGPLESQKDGKP